jgi:Pilin accessory protein (PilO)
MGSGVVTVGRRTYAVGLYWENSPSSRIVSAAKEAASQPGQKADFYAIRSGLKDGRVPQFGLGQLEAGHKAGMPAFAGCLANQQPGSWAGAFRLREGTVVTVVRDDLIVPDGDQLYLDETEARERLLQEFGFGGLQKIYAPEAWAIPGSDNMPVSLLLDERRDVKLQSVVVPKSTFVIGGIVAGILILGVATTLYLQDQAAKEAALLAEHQSALERLRQATNPLAPPECKYPIPERKWESEPPPMNLIEACRTSLINVPAVVQGWRMSEVKCARGSLSINWGRDKSYSSPPSDWVISTNASSATSTVSISQLMARAHEDLSNQEDITRRYLAQNWPGTVARLPDDPLPPRPADCKGEWNPPPPPWVKRSFTLTVPDLPSSLPLYFQDLPGVVVNSMAYKPGATGAGGSWSIEGIIYENR